VDKYYAVFKRKNCTSASGSVLHGKILPGKNTLYKTSHQRHAEYIKNLKLNEYTGPHVSSDVTVLTDSGSDDKNIQKAVLKKNRHFICALKSSRGVKSEA